MCGNGYIGKNKNRRNENPRKKKLQESQSVCCNVIKEWVE
jgi:hypothetical protein